MACNWTLLFCVARLWARRPRQRIVSFDNVSGPKRYTVIKARTRQQLLNLIEKKVFTKSMSDAISLLWTCEIANKPRGYLTRTVLIGKILPNAWEDISIRFVD